MLKLNKEQRFFDSYMKSPYKLMDKKQGERYQRKIDIDDFMTGKHFGDGKASIRSMT
jgi:hypothetical protein